RIERSGDSHRCPYRPRTLDRQRSREAAAALKVTGGNYALRGSSVLGERPAHVFTDERGRILAPRFECEDDLITARRIPQRDRDVSYPALVTDATDGAAFGAIQKFLFGPGEQFRELAAVECMARHEVHFAGEARELVPRADQLTIVAAI